jgi:zinc metalloprotease ZmpA
MSLSSTFRRNHVRAAALAGTVISGCVSPDSVPSDPNEPPIAVRATSAPTSNAAFPGSAALPGPATTLAAAAGNAEAVVAGRPAFLHAGANEAFVQGTVVSSSGTFYVPYERTYAGLRVVGGDFVLVIDRAGQLVYHSVALERPLGMLSTTPKLTRAAGEAIAVRQLHKVTQVEGTELVVYALGATARLAWESTVRGFGANGISRLTVDVDAITGAVLRQEEHVLSGSGTAAWNGPNPVALNTMPSGSTFQMRDPEITNLSCQNALNNTIFSGPDDLWGDGNATNRETGCVDALFGAQTQVRMLSEWLGRNAMNGAGGAWPIRIGLNAPDAFYDGTQVQIGHNTVGQWISAIDVIAHEMGHGVDDHTPGGVSRGGTQEFIADAFGTATEWFANQSAPFDVPDFTIGEQVDVSGTGPIRNMADPSAVGHPSCYSSLVPSLPVHVAAGPGDHWFYLLAMGSNPTNGQPASATCDGSTVFGLGVRNAIRILYTAMLMKNTLSSYPRYRTWTLQAAKNLFPGECKQFDKVRAAWDAVSVPVQPNEPTCVPGATDILFQHPNGGLVAEWLIVDGWTPPGPPAILPINLAGPGVPVVGTGDFNGNGTSDIVFQDPSSGMVTEWKIRNDGHIDGDAIALAVPGAKVVGTGDFNADGTTDILFQHGDDGLVAVWPMSDGHVIPPGINLENPGAKVVGTGDFNNDGTTDILFKRASDRQIFMWMISNTQKMGSPINLFTSFATPVGTGDYNSDGTSDIVLQHPNDGLVAIWMISNGSVVGAFDLFSPGAKVVGTGDFDSDRSSDILFQHPNNGLVAFWRIFNGSVVGDIPLVSPGVQVVGTGNFNAE